MNTDMATFFDELASDWDNAPDEYETRERLTGMMSLSPNATIADIGCGQGVLFEHLLKADPAKIIAVDISGEMIRFAEELFNGNRIEYVHGDFLDVRLPMLDAAIFFNSYPHFIDKDSLIDKLAQVLKRGGTMIIAHNLSRLEINGMHKSDGASKLFVPLENAEDEAKKFQKFFTSDFLIDDEEMYFVKMFRR